MNDIVYNNDPIFYALARQRQYDGLVAPVGESPRFTGSPFDRARLNFFGGAKVDQEGTTEHVDWARKGKEVAIASKPSEERTVTFSTVLPGEFMKLVSNDDTPRRLVQNIRPKELEKAGISLGKFLGDVKARFEMLFPEAKGVIVGEMKNEDDGTLTVEVFEVTKTKKVQLSVNVNPEEAEEIHGTFKAFVQHQMQEFFNLYPEANTASVNTKNDLYGTVTVTVSGVVPDLSGDEFHIDQSTIAPAEQYPPMTYDEMVATMVNAPLLVDPFRGFTDNLVQARWIDEQTISVKKNSGAIWPVAPIHPEQTDESVNAASNASKKLVNPRWILADEEPDDDQE